uniref:Glycosyltransferase family 92 protein n=1 Tax=Strongyloides venezuelensis TaxID=75913 RepID=A0A0K0F408_STRVS
MNKESLFFKDVFLVPRNYFIAKNTTIKGIFMAHCSNMYIKKKPNNYLYIKIKKKYYRGRIGIFDKSLCRKFEHRCQMEVHYVDFDIPWKIARKVRRVNIINIFTNTKETFNVNRNAARSKPYNGLTICVPILYWYNNWLQMFLFLENWKREGNAKIVLYYKSLSPEVYNLLQYYVETKLVTLNPVSNYPISKTMNPFNLTHGMGTKIFLNDCMYKKNSKYISIMDVDEYFYVLNGKNKKENVLNFVKNQIPLYPTTSFFNFKSYHISYKNPYIEPSFNFAKIGYMSVDKKNYLGKSVILTSKISHVGFHNPQFESLNDGHRFTSSQAFLLHARSNYILTKRKNLPEINILYESERKDLVERFNFIQKQINTTLPFVYGPSMDKNLESCMSQKVKKTARVCFAIYDKCKATMDSIGKWIYAEDDLVNFRNFTIFN